LKLGDFDSSSSVKVEIILSIIKVVPELLMDYRGNYSIYTKSPGWNYFQYAKGSNYIDVYYTTHSGPHYLAGLFRVVKGQCLVIKIC
jgi:phenolic acid decarboxylase